MNIFGRVWRKHMVMGINRRNLDFIYPFNRREYFPNVDDKLKCKEALFNHGIAVPETYYIVDGRKSLGNWLKALDGINDIVVKPNNSYGGQGILLLHREGENFYSGESLLTLDDINYHILQILYGAFNTESLNDIAYFEYKVDSSGLFPEFIADPSMGIPDIRIIFNSDRAVMAMLRLPTRESNGCANLHQGGIGIGIDLKTGFTLDGCLRNDIIHTHPDTGKELRGFKVPLFRDMLMSGKKVAEIVGLDYIGVDFSIDKRLGQLILEVNARPGLNIQLANKMGLLGALN